jgi:hypothetical protein
MPSSTTLINTEKVTPNILKSPIHSGIKFVVKKDQVVLKKTSQAINEVQLKFLKSQNFQIEEQPTNNTNTLSGTATQSLLMQMKSQKMNSLALIENQGHNSVGVVGK